MEQLDCCGTTLRKHSELTSLLIFASFRVHEKRIRQLGSTSGDYRPDSRSSPDMQIGRLVECMGMYEKEKNDLKEKGRSSLL